jgi:hypothetical protein
VNPNRRPNESPHPSIGRTLAFGVTGLCLSAAGCAVGTWLLGDRPAGVIVQRALWMVTAFAVAASVLLMAAGLLIQVLARYQRPNPGGTRDAASATQHWPQQTAWVTAISRLSPMRQSATYRWRVTTRGLQRGFG